MKTAQTAKKSLIVKPLLSETPAQFCVAELRTAEQQATSNKQQATSNKQQATSNKQQATLSLSK